jgi:uncharacterized protein YfaS (alpha-2-macroglobulin family)
MILKSALSLLLVWVTFVTTLPTASATVFAQDADQIESTDEPGLHFRLSEGKEVVEARPSPSPLAPAKTLSAEETKKLLARLPALTADASDALDFKLREQSLPPPRAGKTIQAAFALPATDAPPAPVVAGAPLEVTRFMPEGEVELAPMLSVTFSQPMVAVSSQTEAAAIVPVTLAPQPQGKWRWLGAQTLVFQPEAEGGRLPMATNYTITIPAGTRSALGNTLRETRTFKFATPPLKVENFSPAESSTNTQRDRLMFLEFDQLVDQVSVLEHLKLQAAGADARLRLATPEEIAADFEVNELVKAAEPGRWLVVRAIAPNGATKEALPFDTQIKIVLTPGAPSAEGARTTVKEQSFTFKTHGLLKVTETRCSYSNTCAPFDPFQIVFSNGLDDEAFRPAQVRIAPEIPDAKIQLFGNTIHIEGAKRSNTTYTVTLDRAIQDSFKQTLSGNNEFSFNVTTSPSRLFAIGGNFQVLDPAGPRAFAVYTVNFSRLRVELYKVTPEDWNQFLRYQRPAPDSNVPPTPPGRLVSDKIIDLNVKPEELTETNIDISPALTDGLGQVFVRVDPVPREEDRDKPVAIYLRPNRAQAWLQSTNIGLDAFVDNHQLVAWTNSLKDGRPLAGVELSLSPDDLSGVTGSDGLARLAFKDRSIVERPPLLVARRGGDVAILARNQYSYYSPDDQNTSWRRTDNQRSSSWYVFDDRKLYRPGEQVNVKGWLRKVDLTPTGDTELYTPDPAKTLHYILEDSQGNEITKGTAKLNALAGFDLKLQLPPTMNLGAATIKFEFRAEGESPSYTEHEHHFQVQEFRRPEFELTMRTSEAPHFVGSAASVTVAASYYSGGALATTDVEWTVTSTPTNYTPPNRDDYTFGKFIAWWRSEEDSDATKEQSFDGETDAAGKHTLKIDFDAVKPARPSSVTARARVQDVNRQTIASSAALLVHPADVYVGLKSTRNFVQPGEPFDLAAIVTDLDGKALAGREVRLRLVRLEWVYEQSKWKQQERDPQEQTLRSGAEAVNALFQTTVGGLYRLTAQVRDERERLNETELSLWVAGGKQPPNREIAKEKVELIPDRRNYAANDVAEILVQSPFAPAEGVMTLRRSGLLRTERFTMNESSYTLRVPIAEAMTPNIEVQVDLVGAAVRTDDEGSALSSLPRRPAFASGDIKLEIPPATRRLTVTATPRETVLEPGGETVIDIEVKNAQGRSVAGTDTAVIVVDESVLALTGYKLADPLAYFYSERDEDVTDYHLRENVALADPERVKQEQAAGDTTFAVRSLDSLPIRGQRAKGIENNYFLDGVDASDQASVGSTTTREGISVRQNFNALAVFAASLPTDAKGRAQVKVKLPDNLTRYRVMAVSVAGGKLAGLGEAAITARKQLMARPSAPRFLNFGDAAELPIVLQNQTDKAMNVDVAVRATNATLTDGAGRRVTVPANDRVEVRFPIAAVKPGTARFQIAAASGAKTDAAELSLPVYTPATTEAFATYGVIDEGSIAQTVQAPAGAVPTFGGVEITTASTQLQELTDAFIYLVKYPYECSEQISSRVLGIVALKDVLTAFKAKDLPPPESLRDSVNDDLKRLGSLQNADGGFGFWRQGEVSNPYVTVHVAHALARAKSKGFAVSPQALQQAGEYLDDIEDKIPAEYSAESRRAIQAYALYVRELIGESDGAEARRLIAEAGGVEKLSLESLGWLLPVVSQDSASKQEAEAIRRHFNNRVTETAGAAHFADSYSDGAYTILHSNRRADGVILDALIGDQPKSDLIPKLVRGLLAGRDRGRWLNTQENVFILLALDRYFNTYENTTPDFVARVWLGDDYAGEQVFKGRSIDRQQLNLAMPLLVERTAAGPANLTIGKEGPGRLYFRIGARYAPANLRIAAADYGFAVERKYEAIDDPADVQRETDGTWVIRAGARVRVRISMSNSARRYHVALVDPLPAGLEPLNPELATTERLPDESVEEGVARGGRGLYDYYRYWRGTWYEHQNLRDERVEAFTSLLWEGVHEYTYFARATTPGLFVVPPAKAEEMYAPETFGRGPGDRVRVK